MTAAIATTSRSSPRSFWAAAAGGALLALVGLGSAHMMESHGHAITGMDNQVVWGLPHVFAIFMIVAASGVLNVASIGSVFGQAAYKPRSRLAGLLGLALLAGGLMVLMLDLGRPERVIVAATHYNPSSVFAWNVLLYSGMSGLIVVYLWTSFERRLNRYTMVAGIAVLVWRFVLTSGTGSIFAFLVARAAYASPLMAPLFIVLSFGWGMAVFLAAQHALYARRGLLLDVALAQRLGRLLGLFVAASLFLVAVQHLTSAYWARNAAAVAFLLRDGGVFPWLFWGGFVALGSLLPMALVFRRGGADARGLLVAALAVAAGAFAWLFVFIVGGQSMPLDIFPGFEASSSFGDGAVAHYSPSVWEWGLGLGGLGAAFLISAVGAHVLDFLPRDDAGRGA